MFRLYPAPTEAELEWMSKNSMWTEYKRHEPLYMRLAEVNVSPVHTKGMDDVECFIAWLDYMVEHKLTGFHISSTKFIPPVDQARWMLEMVPEIERHREDGTLEKFHD